MSESARYRVKFRRRREQKTDYRRRLSLVKSELPRLVVRVSNSCVRAQLVRFVLDGDRTVASACSKELGKYGWKGGLCNIPSAYLTGLLIGRKAGKDVSGQVILDIGRQHHSRGGRLFAVLKGARDAGIDVKAGKEAFPSEERLSGKHIAEYGSKLGEKKPARFSAYLKRGLDPEKIAENFASVKGSILKG